jgi:DNA polymerase III epsilon subunit-like protein
MGNIGAVSVGLNWTVVKMSKEKCMIDIETLGIEPGSAILSIGAVRFDLDGLGEEFSCIVDLESCQEAGLEIDANTLEWWLSQDSEVQHILTGGIELKDALEQLSQFYGDCTEVWANSPAFDCSHLEKAYDAVGIVKPWTYSEKRDVRTVVNLDIAPEMEQEGNEHDALDDARYQAKQVIKTLHRVNDD